TRAATASAAQPTRYLSWKIICIPPFAVCLLGRIFVACLGKDVLAGCPGVNASQGQEFEIDGMERPDCRRDETAALLAACVRSGQGFRRRIVFEEGAISVHAGACDHCQG